MTLALFDLDNTLLGGDSDFQWGCYMVEKGIVDEAFYKQKNEVFYRQYEEGKLDIQEFLSFALSPLGENDRAQLEAWRADYVQEKIAPIMLDKGRALLEKHRQMGHTLVIITATNRFVTAPIAEAFGVEHLLATEVEEGLDGQYTGRSTDTPCFKEGKVTRLKAWMAEHGHDLEDSWFYSDSHNDLPLLNLAAHPHAVDPDPTLRDEAEARGWPILTLRD
ncbi:HAD family hydrolase [Magnetofaba australis]|uniref:Histidinol-phosphatase n=1 Tax=Magnetofaba australis IT-1 TaxID=1434232 RepID=A0A1Y2K8F8_9PROT|nr:HAD family hydrolase [Magnetofaba australis]OSM04956.1 putative HAD hydrolase, family IB [Magnetofaba australis IT-1]